MSEGANVTGGFVNGRCYAEKASENGPPLYKNGDFQFQGAPHMRSISSRLADITIISSPSKAALRLAAIFH
jgi:hypothetical protein